MHSFPLTILVTAILPVNGVLARLFARANQCGGKGYETATDAYYYNDSDSYAGFDKCSQHCLKDASCKAMAVDGSTCMHFSVAVTGNFEADQSSPETFWDRGCLSTASGTSTTTTGATKSSTTTVRTSTTTTTTAKVETPSSTKTASTTTTPKATSKSSTSTSSSSSSKATTTTISSSKISTATPSTKTSTTSVKATTSSTTTASASSTGVAVPSGCNIPPSYTITSFSWFNSSHNLDCVTGPDLGDGTGCIDSQNQWCNPKTNANCTDCGIPVCSTGLPPQPLGYGPPDDVKFTFSDGSQCEQLNPAVVHRYEVGDGYVNCGSSYDFLNFYGSSAAANNTGSVVINGWPGSCADGDNIASQYSGTFPIFCTRDAQNNATCTAPRSITIPLVSYNKFKNDA